MQPRTFRYDLSGNWYKGNTHIHSTASDGGMSHDEIVALYKSAGFDFLFATDHWVCADLNGKEDWSPRVFDAIELDGCDETGSYYHVVCLGSLKGLKREDGFEDALRSVKEQGGVTILAHPHWCGNTFEEADRWQFDGVEIYNHVCHWLNGKSDGLVCWNSMLSTSPATLSFAADDAHLRKEHPGWNGGWVVVNAPELSQEAILAAIRKGNFYSSCGPDFKSVSLDGNTLTALTSAVQFARLVGPKSNGQRCGGFEGELMTEVSFEIPADWEYMYLEIEDAEGKRAWSNQLFV